MKGVDDSSVKGIVLQTMVDRLIVVRDPNPNFHTKVSGINLREPSPDQFDFTANKTAYFDALFALGERDKVAYDVIWSTFEENATTVEYAAGNHDFGPFYKTLQGNLGAVEKRHTNGAVVSADIFDDPQFKALVPYYTTFWSNWQFAGEMARFQYLHDQVTSKRLRQLADEAGKSPQTKTVQGDLLGLAGQVDLFYGDIVQAADPLRAEDSNAPQSPTSLNTARLAQLSSGNFAHVYAPPTQPWDMKDYNMNQVIAVVQKLRNRRENIAITGTYIAGRTRFGCCWMHGAAQGRSSKRNCWRENGLERTFASCLRSCPRFRRREWARKWTAIP